MKRLLAPLMLVVLAACRQDAAPELTSLTVHEDTSQLHILIDGGNDTIISHADFSLNGGPAVRDNAAPFEHTVSKSNLPAGEHTVDVTIAISVLNEVSNVSRRVSFVVGSAPTKPGLEPTPGAGAICPASVHDLYTTTWSGKRFRTWHPQIDPATGCHFDHEHGSDPSGFRGFATVKPVFDVFAGKSSAATGNVPLMSEPHRGFKVFVFEGGNHSWMITQHMTGSSLHRLCQRYHSTNTAVATMSGEVVVDLHYKGDWGKPRAQTGFGTVASMRPEMCPSIADNAGFGTISVNVLSAGGKAGYESWVNNTDKLLAPVAGKFIPRIDEYAVACSDTRNAAGEYTCPHHEQVITYENGKVRDNIERWFDLSAGFGFDTRLSGKLSGHFCTDYTLRIKLNCTDTNAFAQYVKPGLVLVPYSSSTRYAVPAANIVNSGPNAFKFVPGQPGERNYNLGSVQGLSN